MKKNLIAVILVFCACSNNISEEKILAYESSLNNVAASYGIDIYQNPVKCRAIEKDVECKISSIDLSEEGETIASLTDIISKTNGFYQGKKTGLISVKEYLNSIKSQKIFQEFYFKAKLSDSIVSSVTLLAILFKNQEIINILNDTFGISIRGELNKTTQELSTKIKIKAIKSKLDLSLHSKAIIDEKLYEELDKNGVKYRILEDKINAELLTNDNKIDAYKHLMKIKDLNLSLKINDADKINVLLDLSKIISIPQNLITEFSKAAKKGKLSLEIKAKKDFTIEKNSKMNDYLEIFLNGKKIILK